MPPPWISKSAPSSFSAIAEHSICQPGRPGPHGRSQAVSSPGFLRLPEREVERVLLEALRPGLLALVHLVRVSVRELAVVVEAPDAEVHVAARLVGELSLDQRLDELDDLGHRLGRERFRVGTSDPEQVRVLE